MPVSGLVITLDADVDRARAALTALRSRAAIAVGAAPDLDTAGILARRVPIVVDACDASEEEAIWNWLQTLPGVVFVDLVCSLDNDGKGPDATAK